VEAGALQAPAGLSRISISAPLLRLRSDDQLVAHFRAGNEEAFQVIFDRYRQRLFAYTRQMLAGSRQDAEDALQDVFLRAYAALRANDRPVSLRAWLYRVAHNRCIDQLRRPTPAHADVFDVSRSPLRDPLAETERREDLRRLVEDVQRLPEAQRSALLMREIDGLSYQELADALEVTVPAIKSLLVRARIGLVEAIEARDTACVDIRTDLLCAYDKGVRASGKARRHLRDCSGCRAYRTELRTVQRGLGALSPGHAGPFSLVAKLFGLGGAGGGAAAGGGAVLGGGGAVVAGGGATAATACKVAAIVCSAALVTGAASEVKQAVKHAVGPERPVATAHAPAAAPVKSAPAPHALLAPAGFHRTAATGLGGMAGTTTATHRARADEPSAAVAADREGPITHDDEIYADPLKPAAVERPVTTNQTGGALAPVEDPSITGEAPVVVTAPSPSPAAGTASTSTTGTSGTSSSSGSTGTTPNPSVAGGTSAAPATTAPAPAPAPAPATATVTVP
jgi:RNA polymerase sigma factor (sigma-70 family)